MCVVPGQTTKHSKAAINHLVFRKAVWPSLQGVMGDAQMVEYIDFRANKAAFRCVHVAAPAPLPYRGG